MASTLRAISHDGSGNFSMSKAADRAVTERVAKVIAMLRPMVQSDGGDIELLEVLADGEVRVRLHGACIGCPSAAMTLSMGIERNLKEQVPEVTRVTCA
jgi:Fe-S cluster biogenesis protein NfuA